MTIHRWILAAAFVSTPARADAFDVSYGGRLTESPTGKAVEGPVDLELHFYAGQSTATEIVSAKIVEDVPLSEGAFALRLPLTVGERTTVFDSAEVWIEVKDLTHVKAYPRQRFTGVPYALRVPVDSSTLGYDGNGQLFVKGAAPTASFTQANSQYVATDEIKARDADGIKISSASGPGMVVADSGNVGIGTTTPSKLLTIALPGGAQGGQGLNVVGQGGSGGIQLINGTGTVDKFAPSVVGISSYNLTGVSGLELRGTPALDNAGQPGVSISASNPTDGLAVVSSPVMQVSNFSTPLLTVGPSGNVGIGTTSPAAKLANVGAIPSWGSSTDGILWKSTQNDYAASIWSDPAAGSGFGLRVHTVPDDAAGVPFAVSSGSGFGTMRLAVQGDGNVGIGTLTPANLLDVTLPAGNSLAKGLRLTGGGSGFLSLTNGSSTSDKIYPWLQGKSSVDASGVAGLLIEGIPASDTVDRPAIILRANDPDDSSATDASDVLRIQNSSTDLLTISKGGNVGIGTTGPGELLDVQKSTTGVSTEIGAARFATISSGDITDGFTSTIYLGMKDAAGSLTYGGVISAVRDGADNQQALELKGRNGATANNGQLWLDSSGNVGIGTTSPQSSLQVAGYIQLDLTSGAPSGTDCDAATERGRMKVDNVAGLLYICMNSGWVSR